MLEVDYVNAPPLKIQLDFRSRVPIYVQIVEQVRRQVESGDLNPGDQLPTVRLLATELRVNFNTVARAYRLLDEAGLISTQQGRGTYIWERPSPETIQELRHKSLEELSREYLKEINSLGYSPAEALNALWQIIESDGPVSLDQDTAVDLEM
jgi:GntR family transcriptional regulator